MLQLAHTNRTKKYITTSTYASIASRAISRTDLGCPIRSIYFTCTACDHTPSEQESHLSELPTLVIRPRKPPAVSGAWWGHNSLKSNLNMCAHAMHHLWWGGLQNASWLAGRPLLHCDWDSGWHRGVAVSAVRLGCLSHVPKRRTPRFRRDLSLD